MIKDIRKVYDKFKDYDYIDQDFSTYYIKSPKEFEELGGGICWDFVVAIVNELDKYDIPYSCYFSDIQRKGKTMAVY